MCGICGIAATDGREGPDAEVLSPVDVRTEVARRLEALLASGAAS